MSFKAQKTAQGAAGDGSWKAFQAGKEEASGRNNKWVKTGESVAQAGAGSAPTTGWVGPAVGGAVGNNMKSYGYIEEGHTAKGLANGFGGHVGEGIADLSEGESAGAVAENMTWGPVKGTFGGITGGSGQEKLDKAQASQTATETLEAS